MTVVRYLSSHLLKNMELKIETISSSAKLVRYSLANYCITVACNATKCLVTYTDVKHNFSG